MLHLRSSPENEKLLLSFLFFLFNDVTRTYYFLSFQLSLSCMDVFILFIFEVYG